MDFNTFNRLIIIQSNKEFGEDIVHIIPLGHEIDRATKIFESKKANRAYILATMDTFGKHSPSLVEEQKEFTDKVVQKLNEHDIETIVKTVDMFEPSEVIRHISSIIIKEKARASNIYINISSAGRLTAAAATLAAMAHKIKAYYIEASGYSDNPKDKKEHGLSICDGTNAKWVEGLPVELPSTQEMAVLKALSQKSPMKPYDIILFLARNNFPGFREHLHVLEKGVRRRDDNYDGILIPCMMKLNKGILEKLKTKGFVTREKLGNHNLVVLQESGRFVSYFAGEL
ncbi:MAG: DUF6293 family protein [Candidatus Bathyarchaeia archaeon]